MKEYIEAKEQGTLLKFYIQPGAKQEKITGLFGDPARIKLMVTAPPVEGKANKNVIDFCSKFFGIKKSDIQIIRGELSRHKDVLILIDSNLVEELLKKVLKE